jgi:twitching motility protein PilU
MAPFLHKMVENKASDLFLTVGIPPSLKIHDKIYTISPNPCSAQETIQAVTSLMNESQQNEFTRTNECNFAFESEDGGRFRVSAFIQRNHAGCVIRHIQSHIPSVDELKLPAVIKDLAMLKKGLIIVVGATGMGKSTTLAAMLGYRNNMSSGHILTIEDPIEYLHTHRQCIVTQREVGVDTASFEIALKNAMRQAPDVIQIGEIRDAATMKFAVSFAETGHLCLATLHANNTYQALERIGHFYPENSREQLWMDLSLNLRAIMAQQLVPHINGKSRVAAMEVLISTPVIADAIRKGEIHTIREYMMRKNEQGMQSFDQSLFHLFTTGQISHEDALAYADSANNLRLMIKLRAQTGVKNSCGQESIENQYAKSSNKRIYDVKE